MSTLSVPRPELTLAGKTALITGGGAGIGRAIVETFAQLGARVVVAEIDPARADDVRSALEGSGIDSFVERMDVCDEAEVAALIAKIDRTCGRLDVLVNNVGHYVGPMGPFHEGGYAYWDALYHINLRHMFGVTAAAIPLMRRSGAGGSIINFST